MRIWVPTPNAEPLIGAVPGVTFEAWPAEPPDDVSDVRFFVPNWLTKQPMAELFRSMKNLQVVQVLNAGVDWVIDHVGPEVTVCNAGNANAAAVADWCVAALLTETRSFRTIAENQRKHKWKMILGPATSTLRVGIVGYGGIGKALHARLHPFGCVVTAIASRERIEAGPGGDVHVHHVEELASLVPALDALIVLAPLTPATRGLISAHILSLLPDNAIVINAARGPLVVTDDLRAELQSGRLRAVLDVTDPEPLPSEHPLWDAPNLRITPHVAGGTYSFFDFTYPVVRENLTRWIAGEELVNVVQGPHRQRPPVQT